jgi:PEP-CTERM motif
VGPLGLGGSATATADALATGSGSALATAFARAGESDFGVTPVPAANASSSAETANGAMAEALSTISSGGELAGTATSTAKTSLGGVSVQSDATTSPFFPEFGFASFEAIAQGGSGTLGGAAGTYAVSAALPDKAYAATLIGGASNVAGALLGPQDEIFGTSILELGSSTFDFRYQGDLLLGIIDQGIALLVTVNGAELSIEHPADDTVINLGSFGPNIDLTIFGEGTFVIGGAVPEPSTWAMLLLGFAGLGYTGYRQMRAAKAPGA